MTTSDILRVPLPVSAITLDLHSMEDAYSMLVLHQTQRGLVRYDASGNVHPALASTWKVLDDGKIYEFQIGESFFSDGSRVNSKHVVNTFRRMFLRQASMSADLSIIENSTVDELKRNPTKFGVTAESPSVVRFTLRKPSAIFVKLLAAVDCGVYRIESPNPEKEDFLQISSGPYKVDLNSGGIVKLVKWRKDALDSAKPPQVIHFESTKMSGDELSRSAEFDVLDHYVISEPAVIELSKKSWNESVTARTPETFLILNPLKIEKKARETIRNAIFALNDDFLPDRKKYKRAFGYVPPIFPDSLDQSDTVPLETHKIIDSKLKPQSGSKQKATLDFQFSAGNKHAGLILYEILKPKLSEIGITLTKKELTKENFLGLMFSKKGDILLGSKGLDYFDPFSILSYFRSGIESNYFHVSSEKVDSMLIRYSTELDPAKRIQLSKEIQKEVLREATVVPLYFGGASSGLWGPKVAQVPPHPGGLHTLPLETVEMSGK